MAAHHKPMSLKSADFIFSHLFICMSQVKPNFTPFAKLAINYPLDLEVPHLAFLKIIILY